MLRSLAVLGVCLSLVLKMRFHPSVVESKHGWRTAMHSVVTGSEQPEWSLRNGGCVAGLPCDDENEARGKDQEVSCEF
jgi:hypothetical protein